MRRDLRDKIYPELPAEKAEDENLLAQLQEAPYGTLGPHEWALLFDRAFEKINALRSGVRIIDGAYDQVIELSAKLQLENERLRAEIKVLADTAKIVDEALGRATERVDKLARSNEELRAELGFHKYDGQDK